MDKDQYAEINEIISKDFYLKLFGATTKVYDHSNHYKGDLFLGWNGHVIVIHGDSTEFSEAVKRLEENGFEVVVKAPRECIIEDASADRDYYAAISRGFENRYAQESEAISSSEMLALMLLAIGIVLILMQFRII